VRCGAVGRDGSAGVGVGVLDRDGRFIRNGGGGPVGCYYLTPMSDFELPQLLPPRLGVVYQFTA